MEQITDYHRYTTLMRNGFMDKLFFIDKLFDHWSSFLDYGCADGFQTKMIANIFPEKRITGYDKDEEMINRARFTGTMQGNVSFTSELQWIQSYDVIYLSSIMHEVYSYAKTPKEIQEFWQMVFHPSRKTVIIRDMMYSDKILDSGDEKMVFNIIKHCEERGILGEMTRFEEHFGSMGLSKKNIIHFLLKYPYIDSPNWMREVHENYLPLSIESLSNLIPEGWVIDYKELYTLPYLKWRWRKAFRIDVPYTTHAKIIIRRTYD